MVLEILNKPAAETAPIEDYEGNSKMTTTALTQAEIDARIAASNAKRPVRTPINNTEALANSSATIVHINGSRFGVRSLTVAYEEINRSHLKIATAVTHRSDAFEKKKGTQIALKNFAEGKTIIIPRDKRLEIAHQLRFMFGNVPV